MDWDWVIAIGVVFVFCLVAAIAEHFGKGIG